MKELVIVPTAEDKNYDKGKFFENLANKIFKSLRYKVSGNVQYTGMEFDLECTHIDKTNERALVECKAKINLSTTEVRLFAFNCQHKQFDFGYFLYTREYEKQVAGLINELKADDRYKNIYFWDSEKVFELLIAAQEIIKLDKSFVGYKISKTFLLYSYKGIFYVQLLSNSTVPSMFFVADANTGNPISDSSIISLVKEYIPDIADLTLYKTDNSLNIQPAKNDNVSIESIAEIQESETWDDYKPASLRFFVGRKFVKEKILSFITDIFTGSNSKRAFYIDGKSGWGKSSLLNELKGRTRNKFYKNKLFATIIDCRSANSPNFVALAFTYLLQKAVKTSFIPQDFAKAEITSSFNILTSPDISHLLTWLEQNNKLLILVFDQYEDIFKRGQLFDSFYKFLLDVNNTSSNIVVGFSWKSEVNIPIENNSYHLWQQTKEIASCISLSEFEYNESRSIIKQLEKDIGSKFEIDFIRKIIDNSQGFPWLVKKLCIHIKKQFALGISLTSLFEQDFNVESLFRDDLEGLNGDEIKALRYVANRAYNNDALDITELDETISSNLIGHLINKRYLIKSGTKYNISWDIFRDYLVTSEAPKIGETYLLRQPISSVQDAFLCFENSPVMTINDFINKMGNTVAEGAALNLLRELRNIGLIEYKEGNYHIKNTSQIVSLETFTSYLHDKLQKHTFVLELHKIENRPIIFEDIFNLIRTKIKGTVFSEKTLLTYSQIFSSWLHAAEIKLNIDSSIIKSSRNAFSYTPQSKPEEVISFFLKLSNGVEVENTKQNIKLLYDLKSLGLLANSRNIIAFSDIGKAANQNKNIQNIIECALKTDKIRTAFDKINDNPSIKSRKFKDKIPDLLEGINSEVYKNRTARNLFLWGRYIYDNKRGSSGNK
jgi:hypothetical protein